MITNLFSVFDPSTSFISLAWILIAITPGLLIINASNLNNPTTILNNNIISTLYSEVSFTLNNSSNGQNLLLIILFTSIVLMNFSALYPQVFSLTSHLTLTLPLSLTIWVTIVSFGWINNTSHMLSHLVPQGTPGVLISFIVVIELVSNLIRPITLCVRLTANLIAGHLLITLLGNSLIVISSNFSISVIFCPMVLTILESAVAFIQAYVFITLSTLYITEIN